MKRILKLFQPSFLHKFGYSALFLFACFFMSCRKDEIVNLDSDKPKSYLHLSHTRTKSNPDMDEEVEKIDFEQFDMLWLGGDLAYLSSKDIATMNHIDSVFDIGNPATHWALGNHDYSNLNTVKEFTKRDPFYASYQNGITVVVLDTQDSLSNIVNEQKELLINVLDTIQESSHLVLLHHKLIWMYGNEDLEPQVPFVSNTIMGDCFYCINPNNFNTEIYPKLVETKKKGVEVVCVGGDIGFKSKEFEHVTPDGIYFLASGIHAGKKNNKALLFSHHMHSKKLTWEFVPINELSKK